MNDRAVHLARYLDQDLTVASTVSFGTQYDAVSSGANPLINGWIGRIEQKRFPRIESQLRIVWERRMLRIQVKRWDRRKMLIGEWAWRIGVVWAIIGTIVLTVALASLLVRMVVG